MAAGLRRLIELASRASGLPDSSGDDSSSPANCHGRRGVPSQVRPACPACLLIADAVVGHQRGQGESADVGQRVLVVAGSDSAPVRERDFAALLFAARELSHTETKSSGTFEPALIRSFQDAEQAAANWMRSVGNDRRAADTTAVRARRSWLTRRWPKLKRR